MKRLPAMILIWLGCALAWTLLGTSLVARTGGTDSALRRDVHRLWGPPLAQGRPAARLAWEREREVEEARPDGRGGTTTVTVRRRVTESSPAPVESSAIAVRLDLEHRRKGLLWFPTYGVGFEGRYEFTNPADAPRTLRVTFPLAEANTVYDGFAVSDAAGAPVEAEIGNGCAAWSVPVGPGERRAFTVRYRSRGTTSWSYALTGAAPAPGASRGAAPPADEAGAGEARRFRLDLTTNFRRVDFAPGSIAPSRHEAAGGGWRGTWDFERLVASAPIGILLPERLNPGPVASRITFFAPVGLLFFLFVAGITAAVERRALHPMHWFFVGCAFFAFHLLFAYLVDHLPVPASFAIAAAASLFLVLSYAWRVAGRDFAVRRLGPAQLVYLVLFSATFFWDGFTGLAITVGAVATLFVMMQATAGTDWERLDGAAPTRA